MDLDAVSLRPANSDDEPFLRSLFYLIRGEEFERAGLAGPQLEMILQQQYTAMRTYYAQVYPDAEYVVYESDGERIGYHATARLDTLHLIDISILPHYCGHGLGTRRMQELQSQAAAAGLAMTLTVEKFNPALRLYERLGFIRYQDSEIYQRMRWEASVLES